MAGCQARTSLPSEADGRSEALPPRRAAALLTPAQHTRALGDREQEQRRRDRADEADEVQLPDRPLPHRVRDLAADDGADDAERERPEEADLLPARKEDPREHADHEPGCQEADHVRVLS